MWPSQMWGGLGTGPVDGTHGACQPRLVAAEQPGGWSRQAAAVPGFGRPVLLDVVVRLSCTGSVERGEVIEHLSASAGCGVGVVQASDPARRPARGRRPPDPGAAAAFRTDRPSPPCAGCDSPIIVATRNSAARVPSGDEVGASRPGVGCRCRGAMGAAARWVGMARTGGPSPHRGRLSPTARSPPPS
jgi:hypothetical protein